MGNIGLGKTAGGRERLGKLIREAGKLFTTKQAATSLNITSQRAAKILARWAKQGWLLRIKHGLYASIPIEGSINDEPLEDIKILVPTLFTPGYIGGWTALEHWGLTEQIFRNICVFTAKNGCHSNVKIRNTVFILSHLDISKHFGTKTIWRDGQKILISDPTKTIIDILANPKFGGGIVHTIDSLKQYLKSDHYNEYLLIDYATRLNNGAVFKRMGYLISSLFGNDHPLVSKCKAHLTTGNIQLDPAAKSKRMISAWRILVPEHLLYELSR